MSILLAGALSCALICYFTSFETPAVYAFTSGDSPRPAAEPLIVTEGMIDVNLASFEELITLPGIGKVTAENILTTREMLGAFLIREDLLLVKGIGEKKLGAVYHLIYVK